MLIVDDEHSQAEVLTMLFQLEGFDVEVAANGKQALDRLDGVRPDLIVTDYMMPLMNGGEMAKRVRAMPSYAKIPIVMTSATVEHQIEPYADFYDAFLRKPYLWDDLFAAVKKLLP